LGYFFKIEKIGSLFGSLEPILADYRKISGNTGFKKSKVPTPFVYITRQFFAEE